MLCPDIYSSSTPTFNMIAFKVVLFVVLVVIFSNVSAKTVPVFEYFKNPENMSKEQPEYLTTEAAEKAEEITISAMIEPAYNYDDYEDNEAVKNRYPQHQISDESTPESPKSGNLVANESVGQSEPLTPDEEVLNLIYKRLNRLPDNKKLEADVPDYPSKEQPEYLTTEAAEKAEQFTKPTTIDPDYNHEEEANKTRRLQYQISNESTSNNPTDDLVEKEKTGQSEILTPEEEAFDLDDYKEIKAKEEVLRKCFLHLRFIEEVEADYNRDLQYEFSENINTIPVCQIMVQEWIQRQRKSFRPSEDALFRKRFIEEVKTFQRRELQSRTNAQVLDEIIELLITLKHPYFPGVEQKIVEISEQISQKIHQKF